MIDLAIWLVGTMHLHRLPNCFDVGIFRPSCAVWIYAHKVCSFTGLIHLLVMVPFMVHRPWHWGIAGQLPGTCTGKP